MGNLRLHNGTRNFGRAGRILLGFFAVFISLLLVIGSGVQGATATFAAVQYTNFEKSTIEDDLKTLGEELYNPVDYPKDENGIHRLLDNVGFMEYAYTTSAILSQYYGIYLYVYNPTEKEVSTRSGANVINIAVEYNAKGEPSSYENVEIRLLNATANNRILKFGVVNKRGLYERVRRYAGEHEGERRYDIAGIQLWFKGEQNATDANTERDETSYTYVCTGFCAGCAPDGSEESTLKVGRKKLETIQLDVQHTYFRTDINDESGTKASTLTSVYFSVPDKFIKDYGRLQIVDAEWYEYKTSWVFVTDDTEVYQTMEPYKGYTLPQRKQGYYYDENVPFEIFHYIGPSDSGQQGIGYNYSKSQPAIQRFDWLFSVENIEKDEIAPSVLEDYATNYVGKAGDVMLGYGEKTVNANLFSEEIDEGRTRGYNRRTFDARNQNEWIDLTMEIDYEYDWWKAFFSVFFVTRTENYIVEEGIKPIQEVRLSDFVGMGSENKETYSKSLFVAKKDLDELQEYCRTAEIEGKTTHLLRIGVTDYEAIPVEFHPDSDWSGFNYENMYIARDTAYLDFDIISLGFVRGDQETIIPVVASPIDIYPAITPLTRPGINWWLVVIFGAIIAALVVTAIVISKVEKRTSGKK